MIFYEIEILSVPKILFACRVDLEKYRNRFDRLENFLEIAYCEQGRILFEYDSGEKEITEPGLLIPVFSDMRCRTTAYDNERQRHITVGVEVQYRMKRYLSEQECPVAALMERMKKRCTILIPYHVSLEEKTGEILEILQKIMYCCSSERACDGIYAMSLWFRLAGILSDFVLKKLEAVSNGHPPSESLYARRAVQLIHSHYKESLTVESIAEHLGISSGYLHRIFKNIWGMGVLQYINRYRIAVAVKLIDNQHVSLGEAAHNVGIDDVSYMSRLFKKEMGMSYREYLRQTNRTAR